MMSASAPLFTPRSDRRRVGFLVALLCLLAPLGTWAQSSHHTTYADDDLAARAAQGDPQAQAEWEANQNQPAPFPPLGPAPAPSTLTRPPGPPPNFVPPPPPNFAPPSPPPAPGSAAVGSVPPSRSGTPSPGEGPGRALPARRAVVARPAGNPAAPADQASAEAPEPVEGPDEVAAEDAGEGRGPITALASGPNLGETVGMIRLPELGTNEVLEMLENFTGKPILRQQSLPAVKITFYSQGPMTRGEAIMALESLLSLNGIAITAVGEKFLKAVPASIVNTQVPSVWEGSTLEALPSQQIYTKFFKLDFLTPTESLPLVQQLMSQGAPLLFEKNGTLLVTDSLINLQRIETLLARIDQRAPIQLEMLFFNLRNTNAPDVLRRLQGLQTGALKPQLENNTTFDADERTNQLIIFTHPGNAQMLTDLVTKIDIDVDPLTRTEVYAINYAEAVEIATLIEEVVTGQKQARPDRKAGARGGAQVPQARPQPGAPGAAGENKSVQFSDYFTLVPDERANTIIAAGTANDHTQLKELIAKIDTLLAQVRIEVVITEVLLDDKFSRGIDAFRVGYNVSALGGNSTTVGGGNTLLLPSVSGLQFNNPLVFGPGQFSLDMVWNQARTNSNVKVLSSPTIVTTHNREANIIVGESRPFVTDTLSTVGTGTTTGGLNDNFRSNVQYRDVAIDLKVKPIIGPNGIIQMEIDQKVDNVAPDTGGGDSTNFNPIITKRQATSYVAVADGSMVVLGGLQKVESSENRGRITILGEIPVLGHLFRSKGTGEVRNELLIFIRPSIIPNTTVAHADAERSLDRTENRERVRHFLETGDFDLPETPAPENSEAVRRKGKM